MVACSLPGFLPDKVPQDRGHTQGIPRSVRRPAAEAASVATALAALQAEGGAMRGAFTAGAAPERGAAPVRATPIVFIARRHLRWWSAWTDGSELICCRRLEARGELRGGRFVAGFSAEQYALPAAIPLLRRQEPVMLNRA